MVVELIPVFLQSRDQNGDALPRGFGKCGAARVLIIGLEISVPFGPNEFLDLFGLEPTHYSMHEN